MLCMRYKRGEEIMNNNCKHEFRWETETRRYERRFLFIFHTGGKTEYWRIGICKKCGFIKREHQEELDEVDPFLTSGTF